MRYVRRAALPARWAARAAVVWLMLSLVLHVSGQTAVPAPPAIPEVIGLGVPQAAARLNAAGFRLAPPVFIEDGGTPHRITAQEPPAGSAAEPGTAVTVTVPRPPTTRLVWDANDFTLIWNGAGGSADFLWLPALRFVALSAEGGSSATGEGQIALSGGWPEVAINPGFCAQVWTEAVRGAKDVDGCASARSTLWQTTNDRATHFWTSGASAFAVYQDGVYRGQCAAAAFECTLYLAPVHFAPDVTEYAYLTYSADGLMLVNPSADRWLPAAQITINERTLGDPAAFAGQDVIGTVETLAPGQCLWFATSAGSAALEPCAVVARAEGAAFWVSGFSWAGRADGQPHDCPAVVEGETMVCLLPR